MNGHWNRGILYASGVLLGTTFPFPVLPHCQTGAATAGALLLPRLRRYLIWLIFLFLAGQFHLAYRISHHDLRVILGNTPQLATVTHSRRNATERIYLEDGVESIRTMARLKVTSLQREHYATGFRPD